MDVKEKIIEISKLLDELDDFGSSISDVDQSFDFKLSDLYHYLENNKMDSKKSYRFCKELKSVLEERRIHKINASIFYEFNRAKDRYYSCKDNRKIVLSQICHNAKIRENGKYNNRIYNSTELKEKLEG